MKPYNGGKIFFILGIINIQFTTFQTISICIGAGNVVIIEDGVCKLADRSALAGSVATMDRLIRTMVQNAEIPLADAVRMASETPARIMGVLDRKGTLERGKDADIIALDRDLNVRAVWAMGQLVEGTNKLF